MIGFFEIRNSSEGFVKAILVFVSFVFFLEFFFYWVFSEQEMVGKAGLVGKILGAFPRLLEKIGAGYFFRWE